VISPLAGQSLPVVVAAKISCERPFATAHQNTFRRKISAGLARHSGAGSVHKIDARDGTIILIALVNAESELGAALSERLDGDVSCLGACQVASWRAVLGPVPSESGEENMAASKLDLGDEDFRSL